MRPTPDPRRISKAALIRIAALAVSTLTLSAILVPIHAQTANRKAAVTSSSVRAARPSPPPALTTVSGLKKFIAGLKRKADKPEAGAAFKPAKPSAGRRVPAAKSVPFSGRGLRIEGREKAEGTGTDYLESLLYYTRERAYPRDSIDWSAYRRARAARGKLPPSRLGKPGGFSVESLSGTWEFMGPRNLTVPYRIYYGDGYVSGRVNSIAYDPVTAGTWYVGSASGGVWKTTNFGTSWTNLTDAWPALQVGCISIDPNNNQRIFVGTGDFNGFGGYGFGIMRSLDGGSTWTNIGQAEMGAFSVNAILIDPDDPDIITATAGRGSDWWGYIWRSTDGGNTWASVLTTYAAWNDLRMSQPTGGTRYYYAAGGGLSAAVEVWRSANRGATWTKLSTPATSAPYMVEVATSATAPLTVYLISPDDAGIWRSDSKGDTGTWTNITGTIPGGSNWSQGWYDLNLTTSTRTVMGTPTDVLYCGLITISQSPSGNGTWQDLGETMTWDALTHNDQHAMAIDPANANQALVGNDGGLYGFTYDPGANTWTFDTTLNGQLGITQFYHTAPHPTNPDIVIGGTQDNATPISLGDLNNWSNTGGGDGGGVAIDNLNPNNQYATSQNFDPIWLTPDSWGTVYWDTMVATSGDRLPFIGQIAIDPSNPHLLYVGTNYLWRYNRLTNSWAARLGTQQLSATDTVRSIAVAPTDSQRIYTGSADGELWMTTNGGSTWTQINTGTVSLPNRAITSIAVDPINANRIVVCLSGTGTEHVWRCNNTIAGASRTWQARDGLLGAAPFPDIPANEIVLDLDDPINIYYVATDIGVFMTEDAGLNWQDATVPNGLPNVQVNSLEAVQGTRLLVAGTYGRGIWRISLPAKGIFNSLSLAPVSVQGGVSSTGTIVLNDPAPMGGLTVTLKSNNVAYATVPASVVVPQGSDTANFTVTTYGASSATHAIITATSGSWYKQARLDITPTTIFPIALSANPPNRTGGVPSTGKVTLNVAPAANTAVPLSSSNTGAANVPASVTVLAGKISATFPITTYPVASDTSVTISATLNSVMKSAVLSVKKPVLASLLLSPADVLGGGNATGKVTLTGTVATGAGPFVVALSSNNAVASVPATVSVVEGANSATFTITTTPVASSTVANISSTAGAITKSANLTVKPPTVKSLALSPNTVTGGQSTTGTVTLTGWAPAGGATVTLVSNNGAAQVPGSVVVQEGFKTATFTVTTSTVGTQTKPLISATRGNTKSAILVINP